MTATRLRAAPRRLVASLAAAAAFAAGCGDGPTDPDIPTPLPFTASGTLRTVAGAAVPAGARVVVVWAGDDGTGDYGYVWGGGPVDAAAGRFTVTFTAPPPAAATLTLDNGSRAGVGVLLLVPGAADVREGRIPAGDRTLGDAALGLSGQHAVIYRDGTWPSELGWAGMRPGYNVGRGVPARPGEVFDTFRAVAADAAEVVVDALRNIPTVNWS